MTDERPVCPRIAFRAKDGTRKWITVYTRAALEWDIRSHDQTRHVIRQSLLCGLVDGFSVKSVCDDMDRADRACEFRYRMNKIEIADLEAMTDTPYTDHVIREANRLMRDATS